MQYTIRGIPPAVDHLLRKRARASGKSLNEVAIETLVEGIRILSTPRMRRNLDDIAGTWVADKAFDAELDAQDQIDADPWK